MRELEEELERKDSDLKGLENKLKGELKNFELLSEENAKNVEDLRKLEVEVRDLGNKKEQGRQLKIIIMHTKTIVDALMCDKKSIK